MPSEAAKAVLFREYDLDQAYCYYCQRQYATPFTWYQHLRTQHSETVRWATLRQAMEEADRG